MFSVRHVLRDAVVVVVAIATIYFLFQTYREPVTEYLFGLDKVGIFVRDVPVTVSIADTPEERSLGLSGVKSLEPQEGKLFVFDQEGNYGFWMRDMNFAIDIIWINNDLKIVHIEKNVQPDTYPTIFNSPLPARLVLETRAFFADTFNLSVGDQLSIPANKLPPDLHQK